MCVSPFEVGAEFARTRSDLSSGNRQIDLPTGVKSPPKWKSNRHSLLDYPRPPGTETIIYSWCIAQAVKSSREQSIERTVNTD
jgi:hypothetical protein